MPPRLRRPPQLPFGQAASALGHDGLNVPDAVGVLVDAAVAAEEAHAGHAGDALGYPLVLVAIGLVHQRVRFQVAVEVVLHQVVVAVVAHRRDHAREVVWPPERARLHGREHLGQLRVDRVRTVRVVMAQVLDVLGQVAKPEDVVLADLARDFDLVRVSLSSLGSLFSRGLALRWHRHTSR